MRIQAINTNTNFRGLFTDKKSQNGGNWKMEYQPYSWEKNEAGEIGRMANKQRVDVYASTLPDNEEIYNKLITNYGTYSEYSDDILGTRSYYRSYDGSMRRTITEMPPMNREESLEVLNRKYDKFLQLKDNQKKGIVETIEALRSEAENISDSYNRYSARHDRGCDYAQGFMQKTEGLRKIADAKIKMDNEQSSLKDAFGSLYSNSQNHIILMDSTIGAKDNQQKIKEELNQIKELQKSGKLIDISRRGVKNQNAPLEAALQNIKAAAEKFICLPHKIISMAEILRQINPRVIEGGYNNEIIRYIEILIRRGV